MVAVRKFYFHSKAHVLQKSNTNYKNFRCAALLRYSTFILRACLGSDCVSRQIWAWGGGGAPPPARNKFKKC